MLHYLTASLIASPLLGFQIPFLQSQVDSNLVKDVSLRSKPAVVRIVTACSASGVFDFSNVNPNTTPFKYDYSTGEIGSGFLISSNGYIVTNYSIVRPVEEEGCKERILRNLVEGYVRENFPQKTVKTVVKAKQDPDLRAIVEALEDHVKKLKVDTSSTKGRVVLPNGDEFKFDIAAQGVALGGDGKDVAIIKIPVQNAPTLSFAAEDPATINLQDPVLVIGYPFAADVSSDSYFADFLKADAGAADKASVKKSLGQASVASGNISNPYKTTPDDTPILQLDTLVSYGNSGSPVLNNAGQVIGMVTFSVSADFRSGGNVPFAIPVSTIMEYVRRSGSSYNQLSNTDQLYQDGLKAYDNKDFVGAKAKFEAVASNFEQHSEATRLIQETNERIADRWVNQNYVPWLLGLGGVLAGLAAVSLLWRRGAHPQSEAEAQTQLDEPQLAAMAASAYRSPTESENSSTSVGTFNPFSSSKHESSSRESSNRRSNDRQQEPSEAPREGKHQKLENGSALPSGMIFPPNGTVITAAQPFLELQNSQGRTQQFNLCKKQHKLGRDRSWADLDVPEIGWEILSKRHALFKQEENGENYRIFDGDGQKRSTNGVFINGALLPIEGYLLQDQDQLVIGRDPRTQVTIQYYNPSANQTSTKTS